MAAAKRTRVVTSDGSLYRSASRLAARWVISLAVGLLLATSALAGTPAGQSPLRSTAADTNRAPEIEPIGTLEFYQMDTLRVDLDTLVTDDHTPDEEMEWEVEVLDSRYLDNPNSSNDQHITVEINTQNRMLTVSTTRFFRASNIPVRLRATDGGGLSDHEEFRLTVLPVEGVPGKVYELKQNYPNPFGTSTTIEFWIPVRARVILNVYDLLGRKVARLVDRRAMPPGIHAVEWSPDNLASGPYLYRLEALGVDNSRFVKSQEMTLIR